MFCCSIGGQEKISSIILSMRNKASPRYRSLSLLDSLAKLGYFRRCIAETGSNRHNNALATPWGPCEPLEVFCNVHVPKLLLAFEEVQMSDEMRSIQGGCRVVY